MEDQTNIPTKSNMSMVMGIIVVVVLIGAAVLFFNRSRSNSPSAPTQDITFQNQPESQVEGVETVDTGVVDIKVEGGNFYFKPNEIRVKQGQKVILTLTAADGQLHDFVIDELDVKSAQIPAGQSTTVEFTADTTGAFEFYCSVGTHREMGMTGTLIVE